MRILTSEANTMEKQYTRVFILQDYWFAFFMSWGRNGLVHPVCISVDKFQEKEINVQSMAAVRLFVDGIVFYDVHASTDRRDYRSHSKCRLRHSHMWTFSPCLLSNGDLDVPPQKSCVVLGHHSRVCAPTLPYLQVGPYHNRLRQLWKKKLFFFSCVITSTLIIQRL